MRPSKELVQPRIPQSQVSGSMIACPALTDQYMSTEEIDMHMVPTECCQWRSSKPHEPHSVIFPEMTGREKV